MQVRRLSLAAPAFLLPLFCSALLASQDRIAGPIERSRRTALKGNVHPRAQAQYDQGLAEPTLEIANAMLMVEPSAAQQAALEHLLRDQQNPSSSSYREWLTPEQYRERFGLGAGDSAKIVSWLRSEGLTVNDVARGGRWIAFGGTAELVGRAFHTAIHRYRVDGETHFANATAPSIPEALAGVVSGIRGLHDFRLKPQVRLKPAYNAGGGVHYLAPDDLAEIYDIGPLYTAGIDGTGQSLAIMGQTDIDLDDIKTFRQTFNLPANVPQVVLYGPDPGTSQVDLGEADLDLEWSGAVARNATVIFVNSSDVITSAQYAIDQNLAPVMSISYGLCEQESVPEDGVSPSLRWIVQQAAAQGITWLASSGDSGAAGCEYGSGPQAATGLAVNFPASIPEMTAVGGTQFNEDGGTYWSATESANGASALSYIPESAWNETGSANVAAAGLTGFLATGGGASVLFPKPAWQTGPGVPNDNARDVPDVALSAGFHDGYLSFSGGARYVNTGTSCPTPSFAGIVTLLNQYLSSTGAQTQAGLGNINPTLYRLAQTTSNVFHDVTTGNNAVLCAQSSPDCFDGSLGYSAGAGYDQTTGLGSVDAANLVHQWNSPTADTTTVLAANPATVALDSTLQLIATVSAAGGTPSGTVSFVADGAWLGEVPLSGSGGTATAALTVASNLLQAASNNISALYSGDGNFNASSASATVAIGFPPGNSAVIAAIDPGSIYPVLGSAAAGYVWYASVTLTEIAGAPTTLTNFTMNGVSYKGYFRGTSLAANGTLSTSFYVPNLSQPGTVRFVFSGSDASGKAWQRELDVNFLAQALVYPSGSISITPGNALQDPAADPSCQWSQQVNVEEDGGFAMQLTSFVAGGQSFTSQIQQLFGTTQLAPFGALQASLCWSSPPATRTFEVDTNDAYGDVVKSTSPASFGGPVSSPSALSLSPSEVTMSDRNPAAAVAIGLTDNLAQWTVSVFPANRTTSWLQVSALSGTGSAQLSLQASASGLSNGVYNATLIIQASSALPQFVDVPVVFVVGASSTTIIGAPANAGSYQSAFAPGMLLSVFGVELAPSIQAAGSLPLPLTMLGVSATVNGVSAPLYYVSPGQLNIQVPYETGSGTAVLGVNNNGQVASYLFQVAPAAPGIFTDASGALVPNASGKIGQELLLFITGEGDVSPQLADGNTPASGTPVSGLPKPRLPVSVTVGGVAATLQFDGIPSGVAGVTQINFTVPQVPTGPQQVVVTVGGVASAPATLTVTE